MVSSLIVGAVASAVGGSAAAKISTHVGLVGISASAVGGSKASAAITASIPTWGFGKAGYGFAPWAWKGAYGYGPYGWNGWNSWYGTYGAYGYAPWNGLSCAPGTWPWASAAPWTGFPFY